MDFAQQALRRLAAIHIPGIDRIGPLFEISKNTAKLGADRIDPGFEDQASAISGDGF